MKRILLSLCALAALAGTKPLLAQSFLPMGNLDPACMQSAVRQRDTGMISAFTSFNDAITMALATHRDAAVAAWQIADPVARQTALQQAEMAFNQAYNAASNQLSQMKMNVNRTFQQQSLQCLSNRTSSSSSSSICPYGRTLCPCARVDGINTCNCPCNPPPVSSASAQGCSWNDCQPAMGMANRICSDGSVGGPFCTRQPIGTCGWTIRQCPAR